MTVFKNIQSDNGYQEKNVFARSVRTCVQQIIQKMYDVKSFAITDTRSARILENIQRDMSESWQGLTVLFDPAVSFRVNCRRKNVDDSRCVLTAVDAFRGTAKDKVIPFSRLARD